MKVFLTGASGILGTDIKQELEHDNHEVLGFDSKSLDIASFSSVKSRVKDFCPDLIIHSAAMTNVDMCEDQHSLAAKTNIIGTQNLSLAALSSNAKIIYISSCGVYGNGKSTAYSEYDETVPINYHHFTKLEGEKKIKEHNKQFLIIRPGWLFGGTTQHKKNFIEARRKESYNGKEMNSAIDKKGSPTYTLDVAKQISSIISSDLYGTFNVVNEGEATRFDYVKEIVDRLNPGVIVKPVNSDLFPRKANMPNNEVLENFNLNLNNLNEMRHWKLALQDYIQKTY